LLLIGCGTEEAAIRNVPPQNDRICCFGDSLVVGVGVDDEKESYPSVLADTIGREVYTLGTPGDTTANGLEKCGKFRTGQFGIVIVTLGGNDILRRVPRETTEKNLESIFADIQATGAVAVYTGVDGPLSVGSDRRYRQLCRRHGVIYVPNIMKGVLTDSALKSDEIHPNAVGYRLIAERVANVLKSAGLLE